MSRDPLRFTPPDSDAGRKPAPIPSPTPPPPSGGWRRPRTPEDGQQIHKPEDGQPVTTRED